jgi:hypothetical protein
MVVRSDTGLMILRSNTGIADTNDRRREGQAILACQPLNEALGAASVYNVNCDLKIPIM